MKVLTEGVEGVEVTDVNSPLCSGCPVKPFAPPGFLSGPFLIFGVSSGFLVIFCQSIMGRSLSSENN